jgi:hypothetical protein
MGEFVITMFKFWLEALQVGNVRKESTTGKKKATLFTSLKRFVDFGSLLRMEAALTASAFLSKVIYSLPSFCLRDLGWCHSTWRPNFLNFSYWQRLCWPPTIGVVIHYNTTHTTQPSCTGNFCICGLCLGEESFQSSISKSYYQIRNFGLKFKCILRLGCKRSLYSSYFNTLPLRAHSLRTAVLSCSNASMKLSWLRIRDMLLLIMQISSALSNWSSLQRKGPNQELSLVFLADDSLSYAFLAFTLDRGTYCRPFHIV